MTFELCKEEVEIIEGWYNASAGESAHDRTNELFALLEKLQIEAHSRDLWAEDPSHFTKEYQPTVIAHREAIKAYRLRHPEVEAVKEAEEQQPL